MTRDLKSVTMQWAGCCQRDFSASTHGHVLRDNDKILDSNHFGEKNNSNLTDTSLAVWYEVYEYLSPDCWFYASVLASDSHNTHDASDAVWRRSEAGRQGLFPSLKGVGEEKISFCLPIGCFLRLAHKNEPACLPLT